MKQDSEEVDRFVQRVKAGEFAKEPKTPKQTSVDQFTSITGPTRADSKTTARS